MPYLNGSQYYESLSLFKKCSMKLYQLFILFLLILVPLMAIFTILFIKLDHSLKISSVKCIALIASLLNLFFAVLLLSHYDFDVLGYQFITDLTTSFDTLNQSNIKVIQYIERLFNLDLYSNFDYYYYQFGWNTVYMSNWLYENVPGLHNVISVSILPEYLSDSFRINIHPFYREIIENISFIPSFLKSIKVGVDEKSLFFILLTTFITPICILANWSDIQEIGKLKLFLILFLLLEILQIALFLVLDLFWFYIFFESVLIPLFLLIIIWGSSDNKYRAGFLLFLYTLFGSLFMLFSILWIKNNVGTTDFRLLSLSLPNIE